MNFPGENEPTLVNEMAIAKNEKIKHVFHYFPLTPGTIGRCAISSGNSWLGEQTMIVVFWSVFLCRLLTVSLPCFLVLRLECKWQRPLEVSSTYPENRYLKPLVTLDLSMIFWTPILRASTLFEGLLFVCRRSISARCICLASHGASQRFRWAE